jgi:hypothetical protein
MNQTAAYIISLDTVKLESRTTGIIHLLSVISKKSTQFDLQASTCSSGAGVR